MKFSSRLSRSSSQNALSLLLAKKRAEGTRILDLTESNPTHAGVQYPADFLNALANPAAALYDPQPFGMPVARQAVADTFDVSPENVVLTASTSEAYSWLFKLLCDPGDEVLVPRPSYPLFEYLASLEAVQVKPYSFFYDHGWFIDFHALKNSIHSGTRAIILVNPNNPTGHFVRDGEWGELDALCQAHDLAAISDEVFAEYAISAHADSCISLRGKADFVLGGLSKFAGLPQLKLGWIICKESPEPLEMIADTYLSVGAPVQCAAPELLQMSAGVQHQIRERIVRNLARVPRHLEFEGGWYAVVPVTDEEEMSLQLLRDHNVLVQPGYFYDFERSGYLVISLLTAPEIFDEGLIAIETVTSQHL